MKPRYLGLTMIVICLFILFFLVNFNNSLQENNFKICAELCSLQKDSSCSIEACLYNLDDTSHEQTIYIIGLFVAFICGIGFYLLLTKDDKLIEQKHYDLTKLTKKEKNIFLFIRKNNDNGTYQGRIVEEFDLSKATVTRILDKLDLQNLVERKRRGMSNLIVLK